jgi:hypothetical protein
MLVSLESVDTFTARWLNQYCASHPPLDGDKVRRASSGRRLSRPAPPTNSSCMLRLLPPGVPHPSHVPPHALQPRSGLYCSRPIHSCAPCSAPSVGHLQFVSNLMHEPPVALVDPYTGRSHIISPSRLAAGVLTVREVGAEVATVLPRPFAS